ncbi:MAG: tetratricopeptide repeat protein [Candidatus Gastranaerophilaceae bacterium]|jgi:tetratricopeptide (TPR) repeat protein
MLKELVAPVSRKEKIKNQCKVDQILKLAKESHEKYLLKSNLIDLENAIDYYVRAMKLDASLAEPHYKLACLLWEKGQIDIDAAIEQCKNAIKLDPKSQNASIYLGYFFKTAGMYKEAELELKNAIKLNYLLSSKPRLALALTLIEKLQTEKFSFNDFIKIIHYLFSGTIAILWDYSSLRMLYKSILSDISILNYRIKGSFLSSVRKYDLAVENYEQAATKTGKSELFYSKAADLSLNNGNAQEAVNLYKKAIEQNSKSPQLLVKLASILQTYFEEDVEEITDCYNSLLKYDPENARIYYELGHLYTKLKDSLSAINAFKKALEIDPDNPFYHNSMAYAYIQVKHYDEALNEYKKAIKLNPDSKWTSVVCQAQGAIYYQIKGNFEAAITSYETAAMLDPENYDAYLSLGEIYYQIGDIDLAIQNYCEALKINGSDSKTYCCLGIALWEKDCVEESIIAFEKSICTDPQNASAYNNLGLAYLDGTGEIDKAIDAFKSALKVNPNMVMAYYSLGRAYQIDGNNILAADNYQMALDINKITEEMDDCEIESKIYNLFNVNA